MTDGNGNGLGENGTGTGTGNGTGNGFGADARPNSRPLPGRGARGVPYADLDPTNAAPVEDWHLIDALRVLYKRRGTAATVLGLVVVATALYSFTAPEVFEARVQLLIESDQPQVIVFKDAVQEGNESKDYYETQVRILQSRSLARQTMTSLNLWQRPQFDPAQQTSWWRRLAARGLAWLPAALRPSAPAPPGEKPLADEPVARARALTAFLSHLSVVPVKASRLVDVKFQSEDPILAADVANALAQGYIDQDLLSKFDASKQMSEILTKQLKAQQEQLDKSATALQAYRESSGTIDTGQRETLANQAMAGLNNALVQATANRIEKEALFKEVEGVRQNRTALETFPAILSSSLVVGLKNELVGLKKQRTQYVAKGYEAKHPNIIAVDAQIRETENELLREIDKAYESVKQSHVSAVQHEATLKRALDTQKRSAVTQQRQEAKYEELERAERSDRQIFESLLQRTKETGVSSTLRGSNIRIVDPADVPNVPVSPQKLRNILLASVAGLVLALGFAFFFEYFDNRIKSPDEIKVHLGVPCLGMVPLLADRANDRDTPLINNGVPPNFAEAFRIIRTNVLFTQAGRSNRTLAVTSTGPNEGKTMVATNLAIGLALTGDNVLLIDADMRRPRVHECLGVPQSPGLSDVISNQAKLGETVRTTSLPSLQLLACGTLPGNPAELLSSSRFKRLLEAASQRYDWVVIDTPPVLAVTDAAIIANITGGVLFVVGSERTARPTAQTAMEQLAAANANVVGAVLNRVNLKRNAFFYFNYYRRDYEHYYTPTKSE